MLFLYLYAIISFVEKEASMATKIKSNNDQKFTIINRNGEATTHDVQSELFDINEYNYQSAMLDQASKYEQWSSYMTDMYRYAQEKHTQLDVLHSKLYNQKFHEAQNAGTKKPTKDYVESLVLTNDEYQAKQAEVADADYNAAQLKNIVKALEQRKDMLISFGSEMRAEKKLGD